MKLALAAIGQKRTSAAKVSLVLSRAAEKRRLDESSWSELHTVIVRQMTFDVIDAAARVIEPSAI